MKAYLVAGLAFGDEGKGSMVDFLCHHHKAKLVVRYNGGPQAAHNVYLKNKTHHTFAQFGSGSLLPDRETYLSKYMLIEPFAMLNELEALSDIGFYKAIFGMVIDREAVIITPWHWMFNRMKELAKGDRRHGSCGMGVGEARRDQLEGLSLTVGKLNTSDAGFILEEIKKKKLEECEPFKDASEDTLKYFKLMKREDPNFVLECYLKNWLSKIRVADVGYLNKYKNESVVFEGAQGVLLDENYGFSPYVTWTDCTYNNAFKILKDAGIEGSPDFECQRIGVIRTFFTRHGPGPFITEQPYGQALVPAPDIYEKNVENEWQGSFRVGNFDGVALRYALKVIGGVDCLAVTHMDRYKAISGWLYCNEYQNSDGSMQLIIDDKTSDLSRPIFKMADSVEDGIADITNVPIGYTSYAPIREGKECHYENMEESEAAEVKTS